MSNAINDIFNNLTDSEVMQAGAELIEDWVRNDGVIKSKWQRDIARKISEINKQPTATNLHLSQINLLREFMRRNV